MERPRVMEQTAPKEIKEKTGVIPHSIHIDGYYRGFHVEVIETDPDELQGTYKLISNAKAIVDAMEKDGWMPSWNKETNMTLRTPEQEPLKEDLGNCPNCSAPMKISKAGKPYCTKLCWKK